MASHDGGQAAQPDSRLKSKKPPSLVIAIPAAPPPMPRPPRQVGCHWPPARLFLGAAFIPCPAWLQLLWEQRSRSLGAGRWLPETPSGAGDAPRGKISRQTSFSQSIRR